MTSLFLTIPSSSRAMRSTALGSLFSLSTSSLSCLMLSVSSAFSASTCAISALRARRRGSPSCESMRAGAPIAAMARIRMGRTLSRKLGKVDTSETIYGTVIWTTARTIAGTTVGTMGGITSATIAWIMGVGQMSDRLVSCCGRVLNQTCSIRNNFRLGSENLVSLP